MSNNNIKIKEDSDSKITSFFGKISINNKNSIFIITGFVIILSIIGISRLEVENSFINYFNKNTEIYKGMKLIDENLGGTTPLEIILKFPNKVKIKTMKIMNLKIGEMKKIKMMKNIGLQKIKLIKFKLFITT